MSDDPWDSIEARFPAGTEIEGTVTKTKKYGAFLQIADGVEGLLHISELSWEHVERTEDVLRVGDTVKVIVLQADRTRRRISLSYRQLLPRPDHLPPEEAPGDQDYAAAADYEPDMDEESSPEPAAKPKRSRAKAVAEVADEAEMASPEAAAVAPVEPEAEVSSPANEAEVAAPEAEAAAPAEPEAEESSAADEAEATAPEADAVVHAEPEAEERAPADDDAESAGTDEA
jgi:predicted RNA-binding protein with RPS1 domain